MQNIVQLESFKFKQNNASAKNMTELGFSCLYCDLCLSFDMTYAYVVKPHSVLSYKIYGGGKLIPFRFTPYMGKTLAAIKSNRFAAMYVKVRSLKLIAKYRLNIRDNKHVVYGSICIIAFELNTAFNRAI